MTSIFWRPLKAPGAGRKPLALAQAGRFNKESEMSIGTILLIVLVLMLIGVFPAWPHSTGWGYGPSGVLGLVLVVVIVLLVLGKL